jgi:hypothetical protein
MYVDLPTMHLRFEEARPDSLGASLEDLSRHLDVLGIPHQTILVRPQAGSPLRAWFEIAIELEDWPALFRWVPSLKAKIDQAMQAATQVAPGTAPS